MYLTLQHILTPFKPNFLCPAIGISRWGSLEYEEELDPSSKWYFLYCKPTLQAYAWLIFIRIVLYFLNLILNCLQFLSYRLSRFSAHFPRNLFTWSLGIYTNDKQDLIFCQPKSKIFIFLWRIDFFSIYREFSEATLFFFIIELLLKPMMFMTAFTLSLMIVLLLIGKSLCKHWSLMFITKRKLCRKAPIYFLQLQQLKNLSIGNYASVLSLACTLKMFVGLSLSYFKVNPHINWYYHDIAGKKIILWYQF